MCTDLVCVQKVAQALLCIQASRTVKKDREGRVRMVQMTKRKRCTCSTQILCLSCSTPPIPAASPGSKVSQRTTQRNWSTCAIDDYKVTWESCYQVTRLLNDDIILPQPVLKSLLGGPRDLLLIAKKCELAPERCTCNIDVFPVVFPVKYKILIYPFFLTKLAARQVSFFVLLLLRLYFLLLFSSYYY